MSNYTAIVLLIGVGVLSFPNNIVAQETTRRVLRSSRVSEPPPGATPVTPAATGGTEPLGADPSRAESGRPGSESPETEVPAPGDPEENESPEMEDPLSSDPNGGGGDPEENESPEMEDPFSSDPNGGGGDPGENGSPEMEDPFSNDPNGGGGDPEANQSPEMSDPFTDDPFGGGDPEENQSPGMGDPFSEDPFSQAGTVCQVVVYGTSWCGYCTKTKDLLKAQGVSFLDKDIEKDAGAQAEMEAKMVKAGVAKGGVPVIDFCGRIIKGYNEELLLELCQNQRKK